MALLVVMTLLAVMMLLAVGVASGCDMLVTALLAAMTLLGLLSSCAFLVSNTAKLGLFMASFHEICDAPFF